MQKEAALAAFGALSQDTRYNILNLLLEQERPLSVGEINAQIRIAPATLSFHLKTLRDANLVASTRFGRTIRYRARPSTLTLLSGFIKETRQVEVSAARPSREALIA